MRSLVALFHARSADFSPDTITLHVTTRRCDDLCHQRRLISAAMPSRCVWTDSHRPAASKMYFRRKGLERKRTHTWERAAESPKNVIFSLLMESASMSSDSQNYYSRPRRDSRDSRDGYGGGSSTSGSSGGYGGQGGGQGSGQGGGQGGYRDSSRSGSRRAGGDRSDRSDRGGHDGEGERRGIPLSSLDPSTTDASRKVIGIAIEVHKALGPGYDAEVYSAAVRSDLDEINVEYSLQHKFSVEYKGRVIGEVKAPMFVAGKFLLHILSKPDQVTSHERLTMRAQLKAAGMDLGLIINFGERRLKDGLVRVVNVEKITREKGLMLDEHDDDLDSQPRQPREAGGQELADFT
jgi:GxxExxY protein